MLRLDQLEALYYELQLQLYDIQAEVLRCEELLLTAQLQSIRRQMTGESAVHLLTPLNWAFMILISLYIYSVYCICRFTFDQIESSRFNENQTGLRPLFSDKS